MVISKDPNVVRRVTEARIRKERAARRKAIDSRNKKSSSSKDTGPEIISSKVTKQGVQVVKFVDPKTGKTKTSYKVLEKGEQGVDTSKDYYYVDYSSGATGFYATPEAAEKSVEQRQELDRARAARKVQEQQQVFTEHPSTEASGAEQKDWYVDWDEGGRTYYDTEAEAKAAISERVDSERQGRISKAAFGRTLSAFGYRGSFSREAKNPSSSMARRVYEYRSSKFSDVRPVSAVVKSESEFQDPNFLTVIGRAGENIVGAFKPSRVSASEEISEASSTKLKYDPPQLIQLIKQEYGGNKKITQEMSEEEVADIIAGENAFRKIQSSITFEPVTNTTINNSAIIGSTTIQNVRNKVNTNMFVPKVEQPSDLTAQLSRTAKGTIAAGVYAVSSAGEIAGSALKYTAKNPTEVALTVGTGLAAGAALPVAKPLIAGSKVAQTVITPLEVGAGVGLGTYEGVRFVKKADDVGFQRAVGEEVAIVGSFVSGMRVGKPVGETVSALSSKKFRPAIGKGDKLVVEVPSDKITYEPDFDWGFVKAGEFKKTPIDVEIVGGWKSTAEPLSKQVELAGQEVTAVSAQRGLFSPYSKRIVVDKPKPKPSSPEIERSFFADPRDRLRTSRLGVGVKEPGPSLDVDAEFSLFGESPQAVVFERTQVEAFPKSLRGVEFKLKTGRQLTASEAKALEEFQMTPSGKFKPIGFLSTESEITLAPGEIIQKVSRPRVSLIQGSRVDFFKAKIGTPTAETQSLLSKQTTSSLTSKESARLARNLYEESGGLIKTGSYSPPSRSVNPLTSGASLTTTSSSLGYSSAFTGFSGFSSYETPSSSSLTSPSVEVPSYTPSSSSDITSITPLSSSFSPSRSSTSTSSRTGSGGSSIDSSGGGSGGSSGGGSNLVYDPVVDYGDSGGGSGGSSGGGGDPGTGVGSGFDFIPKDSAKRKKKKKKDFRLRSFRYTPTLTAASLGIKSAKTSLKTAKITRSGLGIRPIIK